MESVQDTWDSWTGGDGVDQGDVNNLVDATGNKLDQYKDSINEFRNEHSNSANLDVDDEFEEPDDPMDGLIHRLLIVLSAFAAILLVWAGVCWYRKKYGNIGGSSDRRKAPSAAGYAPTSTDANG